MSGLTFNPLPLADLYLFTRKRHTDDRGSFSRLWSADSLAEHGFPAGPMQVNHSITVSRGTIRGLHYQRPPRMAVRLVSCIRGEIFDVAVAVRPESSTYLHWYGERLSPDNGRAFLIPEGFAHGFQPLTDDCEIVYCHSKLYGSKGRRGYRSASASRME